jgi:hypothetical protein
MNTAKILNLYAGGPNAQSRLDGAVRLSPIAGEVGRRAFGRNNPDPSRSFPPDRLQDQINRSHHHASPEVVTVSEAEVYYLPISDTQAAYPPHTPYIQTTLLAQMLVQDASDQGLEITPYGASAQLYARQQPPPQQPLRAAMDLRI